MKEERMETKEELRMLVIKQQYDTFREQLKRVRLDMERMKMVEGILQGDLMSLVEEYNKLERAGVKLPDKQPAANETPATTDGNRGG